jgi:hypothetical protein
MEYPIQCYELTFSSYSTFPTYPKDSRKQTEGRRPIDPYGHLSSEMEHTHICHSSKPDDLQYDMAAIAAMLEYQGLEPIS